MTNVLTLYSGALVDVHPGSSEESSFRDLVEAARRGDGSALAELVEGCRNYLLLVANQDLGSDVRAKLGASDLVQDAMLSAHRDFQRFEGSTKNEFLAWLRGILKNDLREAHRHFKGVSKRQIDRESPLDDGRRIGSSMPDMAITPGTNAVRNEEAALLKKGLQTLTAEHRTVIELRNWQQLTFSQIGEQMDRSEDAARKLWARAVLQLQAAMKNAGPLDD